MTKPRIRPASTPELAQEICRRLTEGGTLKVTCRDAELGWIARGLLAAIRGENDSMQRADRPHENWRQSAAQALSATTLPTVPAPSAVSDGPFALAGPDRRSEQKAPASCDADHAQWHLANRRQVL